MTFKRVHRLVWTLLFVAIAIVPRTAAAQSLQMAQLPDVTAKAVYVYDATANVELMASNENAERAPASTVKIVTAMVVVDNADLTAQVVVDAQDVTDPTSGESTMNLASGDTVTVEQLLTGLLLPSGNDAARTLARYVGTLLLNGASGDPIQTFVDAMNQKVTDAGLSHTHFTSPDGFSDTDDMYTTAYDLAHLGALAMGYRDISGITKLFTADVVSVGPEAHDMPLQNTNKFLPDSATPYATENVIGLKSGSTDKAGACLVLAQSERGGNLIIAVVLGSELTYDENSNIQVDARWDDMQSVLTTVDSTFAWLNPESNNDVPGLKNEMAAWQVKLSDDSALLIPAGDKKAIAYRLELKPSASGNTDAGQVYFYSGTTQIAARPLVFQ